MKNKIIPISFLLSITLLVSCSSDSSTEHQLVGVWKSDNPSQMAIEFGENGNYYMVNEEQRVLFEDSSSLQYSYNANEATNNFTLKDKTLGMLYKGKLSFKNKDRIAIRLQSALDQSTSSELYAEYDRVK